MMNTFSAKSIAAFVFLLSILVTILAPIIFVLGVVCFELWLFDYPQSEQSDAVGAWGM